MNDLIVTVKWNGKSVPLVDGDTLEMVDLIPPEEVLKRLGGLMDSCEYIIAVDAWAAQGGEAVKPGWVPVPEFGQQWMRLHSSRHAFEFMSEQPVCKLVFDKNMIATRLMVGG